MMPPLPRVMVFSPSGLIEPAMVVGGSRAGALGAFDFAGRLDAEGAAEATRVAMKSLRSREFGLRLAAGYLDEEWLVGLPEGAGVVIATGGDATDWPAALATIRRSGRRALAEVTSRASALAAGRAGFDGLIVAGHEAGGRGSEESSFILLQGVLSAGEGGPPVWVRGGSGRGRPRPRWRWVRRGSSWTAPCSWRAKRRSTGGARADRSARRRRDGRDRAGDRRAGAGPRRARDGGANTSPRGGGRGGRGLGPRRPRRGRLGARSRVARRAGRRAGGGAGASVRHRRRDRAGRRGRDRRRGASRPGAATSGRGVAAGRLARHALRRSSRGR